MNNRLIIFILILGVMYRLFLTWDGNFLFNMDNGRDMVDVREMVVLKKLRLTGPTSAIEGLFNGPAWYYFLAVPFILSGGDPYGSILMEILFWAIGGFCLLKLVSRWGSWLILPIGAVWIASDYIVLTNLYAFNPNPATLLTPLFLYLLYKYLATSKFLYSASVWFLGGLFFNFEMNFGIFIPLIIIFATFFTKRNLFNNKSFWVASFFYILTALPQTIFDLRHQFIMTNSVINFLRNEPKMAVDVFARLQTITISFYNTFLPILMNHKILTMVILVCSVPVFFKFLKLNKKDTLVLISLLYIFIPFFSYLILPVTVNPWHLGGPMVATLILIGFLLAALWQFNFWGKIFSLVLSATLVFFALLNITNFFVNDLGKPSMDPSLFKNEIKAIDYVYQYANGQNFKAYTYLPSVYDYPYQYLFWWYGRKNYGYIPGEYAYSPNKPKYIPSQEKFQGRKDNLSNLVFLIREPDRNYTRAGWEGEFINLATIEKQTVGPIEVEVRQEVTK